MINSIKRLTNEKCNKKYIVLDLQLPSTIDPEDYTIEKNGVYNFAFPRTIKNNNIIDITALQTPTTEDGMRIGKDGFYITPTMRYTNLDGENNSIKEYIVLDNNGGHPSKEIDNIPANPFPGMNMVYLERTTNSTDSTVATEVTTLSTNVRGLMFRINVPWSMSIMYDDMLEKTQKEYDKFVGLMDNLTRFTDMRLDYLDENYENPKFESIIPFKNYATSNNGKSIVLTMGGSVQVSGINMIGDTYWRFYPGGFVFIAQGNTETWIDKRIRLTLAYDE